MNHPRTETPVAKKKYSEPMRVVTFRVPPKVHDELAAAATAWGTDLSSLLNQVVTQALPDIRREHERIRRRNQAAALMVPEEHLSHALAVQEVLGSLPGVLDIDTAFDAGRRILAKMPPLGELEQINVLMAATLAVLKERKASITAEGGAS